MLNQYLWRDVSRSLRPGMAVWPGDPAFSLTPDSRIAEGASCNTSCFSCGTHTGTHVDAPWHFVEKGHRLDAMEPELFFGTAELIAYPGAGPIQAEDLPGAFQADRLLLKTRNSMAPADAPFSEDFVALAPCAAQRIVDAGVRVIGIDALSIAPFGDSGPTHRILLEAGVLIVEGLRLADISEGCCELILLPLPLAGADGAPCRAFVGRLRQD